MLPYPFDSVIRCRFIGKTNGEDFQLVQHFKCRQDIVSVQDFSNALTEGFLLEFRAAMCDTTRFTAVSHVKIRPDTDDEEVELPITPVIGARNIHSMPNQVAHLFKPRTGLDSPAGRGRLYLPGMPQDHFTNGGYSQLALNVLTSICARVNGWVGAGHDNASLQWGVVSSQTDPVSFNDVTHIQFSNYPATMRTRKPHTI